MNYSAFLKRAGQIAMALNRHPLAARSFALLVAVALPYLSRLTGYPNIDEGTYAFYAMVYNYNLAHGESLLSMQGLNLWPLLLSWLPDLPGMPILWFRLADLFAALLATWLMCAIMRRECGIFSSLIALVFLGCMMNFKIVESGFKNAFFPAWACFFGAILIIGMKPANAGSGRCFLAGFLTAFGILLRETFFPFALLGFVSIWIGGNFKKAFFYALGGIFCASFILAGIELLAPGSLASLYQGYVDRTLIYKIQNDRIWHNFSYHLYQSLKIFLPCLLFSVAVIGWNILSAAARRHMPAKAGGMDKGSGVSGLKLCFWLAVSILPLYETVVKISFPYHFAQALPGLACLTAAYAGAAIKKGCFEKTLDFYKKPAYCLLAAACFGVIASCAWLPDIFRLGKTVNDVAQVAAYKWPREMIEHSTTLRVVDEIHKNLPNGGTVSTNGLAQFIYPASGTLPPLSGAFDAADHYRLADLSRFFVQTGMDRERVKAALLANPPELIALLVPLGEHEPSFPEELAAIIDSTEIYEKCAVIDPEAPNSGIKHFTWGAFDIYRRKAAPIGEETK